MGSEGAEQGAWAAGLSPRGHSGAGPAPHTLAQGGAALGGFPASLPARSLALSESEEGLARSLESTC